MGTRRTRVGADAENDMLLPPSTPARPATLDMEKGRGGGGGGGERSTGGYVPHCHPGTGMSYPCTPQPSQPPASSGYCPEGTVPVAYMQAPTMITRRGQGLSEYFFGACYRAWCKPQQHPNPECRGDETSNHGLLQFICCFSCIAIFLIIIGIIIFSVMASAVHMSAGKGGCCDDHPACEDNNPCTRSVIGEGIAHQCVTTPVTDGTQCGLDWGASTRQCFGGECKEVPKILNDGYEGAPPSQCIIWRTPVNVFNGSGHWENVKYKTPCRTKTDDDDFRTNPDFGEGYCVGGRCLRPEKLLDGFYECQEDSDCTVPNTVCGGSFKCGPVCGPSPSPCPSGFNCHPARGWFTNDVCNTKPVP